MSNRAITLSLFGILVVLFVSYFIVLNNITLKEKPIESHLYNIIKYAEEENWKEAQTTMKELKSEWNRIKFPLALNYAEQDYSMLLEYIGRIESAINSEDASQTASDASAALLIWDNFIKVIPQP